MTCKSLDRMDTPARLIEIARCIRSFGSDMNVWSNPEVIAEYLEEHAARVVAERAFREVDNSPLKGSSDDQ